MSDENNVQSTINVVKGVLDAVPVYQDVAQPAAREVGQALQTIAKTVHVLLAPVSALVWGYDQIKDFVSTRVAEKLQSTPSERLTTPEPNIAGPALESLRYTGHKEDLRELYASLLATSMDSVTMHHAHPSFVEIIKQLSSDEALILRRMAYSTVSTPIIDVRSESTIPGGGGHWKIRHFSLISYEAGCARPELGHAYLVNLQRLGLVELHQHYELYPREDCKAPYQPLISHPFIEAIVTQISSEPNRRPEYWKGVADLSNLGLMFAKACIFDDAHRPSEQA